MANSEWKWASPRAIRVLCYLGTVLVRGKRTWVKVDGLLGNAVLFPQTTNNAKRDTVDLPPPPAPAFRLLPARVTG